MVSQQEPKKEDIIQAINNQKIVVNERLKDLANSISGIFQLSELLQKDEEKLPSKEEKKIK